MAHQNDFLSCIDEATLARLFMTLVRPHLEYGNIIWHPRYRIDKIQIEKIQRRATKLIPHLRYYHMRKRLQALNLPSLDFRRRRGDMIQVFKIMNGLDRLDPEIYFFIAEGKCTRGYKDKLLMRNSRLEIRKNVFSQRNLWPYISYTLFLTYRVGGCGSSGVDVDVAIKLSWFICNQLTYPLYLIFIIIFI